MKQPLLKFPAALSYDITSLAVMKLVRPSKKAQLKLVLYYEIPLSAARLFFIVFFLYSCLSAELFHAPLGVVHPGSSLKFVRSL